MLDSSSKTSVNMSPTIQFEEELQPLERGVSLSYTVLDLNTPKRKMHDLKKKIFHGKFPQIFTVVAATLGAIADGMHYGWASPITPILKGENSPIPDFDESSVTLIELLYMFGGIGGLPVTIYIVDKFGRKTSILVAGVANLISWIMLAFCNNLPLLYVARVLCGIAGDMAFVAGPMYIAEIAEKSIRGLLSGFIYIAMLIGIVVIYSVAPFVSLLGSSVVGGCFVLLQLISFSFMPESPYYLLMKKKDEKCRKALSFLRAGQNIEAEFQEMTIAVERQEQERGRPQDLILDKGNRKAVLIMTVLNASQHFSSISVMLMNLHTILSDAQGIMSSESSGIIFSIVMLVSASVAICFVDRFGRKKLLVFSSFLTGISLALLATYFLVKEHGDVSEYKWVPVFSVLLYAVAFKCGLGIVPIVMTGELFPTSVKAMGMTVADAMYVIFGTISIYLYQVLEKQFGIYCPFYLFAACCVVTALFSMFYIPETNGKTLEEIQYILKGIPLSEMKKPPPVNDTDISTKL